MADEEGAKAGEDKRDRFLRVGEPRVNRAVEAIRLLGNLANRGAYAPTDEDVAGMMRALRAAVADVEAKFKGERRKDVRFAFAKEGR